MLVQSLLIFSAAALTTVPGSPEPRSDAVAGDPQIRSDVNTLSDNYGYYPSRRSFYPYPRHRHIDGGGDEGGTFGRPRYRGGDHSPNFDSNHGSAYYGINYGAPYFGGGYYDGGVYYRERRD